ncbi:SHOCT domain-containing protein [Marinilabilia rubra]|uniref:hypothetical protein n=1 Tax=Marinilabilia rubra TaxID=2162893 RepID=UPI0011B2083D|nr:hypothetical protein [Marinilabilia rubra]
MLNFATISGLQIIWTLATILLVVAVWFILKMMLENPEENQDPLEIIRKRWYKGEIEEESYDDRLHHMI